MTRIFLAGLESRSLFDRLKKNTEVTHEPPAMLISYLTAWKSKRKRRLRSELLEYYKETFPDAKILIDSGAFSFHVNTITPGTDPEEYFQDYLEWCKQNRDLFHRCVELDLDDIVGESTVHAWRGEMRAEGIHPIYCWGPARGKKGWMEACDDPAIDYMAVGGGWASDPRAANMVRRAQSRGKKVHGMGFTETIHGLHRMQYYSVDSTSFLKGQKFGTLFLFFHKRLLQLDTDPAEREQVRSKYRKYFQSLGLDADAIIAGDYKEVTRCNALAWTLLGQEWSRRLARKHAPLRATDWPQWALAARAEVGTEVLDSHGNRIRREAETLPLSDRDLARELEGYALDESTGSIVYRGPKLIAPTDADCYLQHTPEGTEVVMKKLPWMKSNGAPKKPTIEVPKKPTTSRPTPIPVSTTTSGASKDEQFRKYGMLKEERAPYLVPPATVINGAPRGPRAEGRKEPIPVEPPPLPVMPDKSTAAIVNGAGMNEAVKNGAPNEEPQTPYGSVAPAVPVGAVVGGANEAQVVQEDAQAHSLLETGERREAGPYEGQSGLTPAEAPGQEKGLELAIRPVRGTVLTEVAPLRCRGCAKQGECPLFYDAEEAGLDLTDPQNDRVDLCRLDGFFAAELIKDRGGLEGARLEVINAQYQRLRRALAFEQMDGGMIDRQVSAEMASFLESVSGILRETSSRGGPPVMAPAGNVSILQILIGKHSPQTVIDVENTVRKYDPLG